MFFFIEVVAVFQQIGCHDPAWDALPARLLNLSGTIPGKSREPLTQLSVFWTDCLSARVLVRPCREPHHEEVKNGQNKDRDEDVMEVPAIFDRRHQGADVL